jgi:hypothetical protein
MNEAANKPVARPAIIGTGSAPTVAAGAQAQLGTGPAATALGTCMACEVTLTPGTTPSAFVASTAYTMFTLTLPAGLFQAAPFSVSIDATNLQSASDETGTNGVAFYYDRAASSATSVVVKAVSKGTPTLANAAYKFALGITG